MKPWEILLDRILRSRRWPIVQEAPVRRQLRVWAALRENDEAVIRELMQWPSDRPLLIDNLGEKIASAYGSLLYGQAPAFTAADEGDQDRLEDMVDAWPAELSAAVETQVSEGEVWWRLSTNPALPHPALTWHSRWDVVPLLHGRNVLACAFVSQLDPQGSDARSVWRHLELHGAGVVHNLLFRGRTEALGDRVDLGRHPETAPIADTWDTGIPELLAGRVVHKWGRRPLVGVSIYAGVWQRLLALHEATTVGRENMRLTAKKRAVVPSSSLKGSNLAKEPELVDRGDGTLVPAAPRVQFDAGEDVLVVDQHDVSEDGAQPPFKVLEYAFDAEALIAWMKSEIEIICQRCDIVPQFIGSGDFGSAPSGTSLRVRLLPTVNAAEGVGAPWDVELPVVTQRAQLLEQLGIAFGGLGNDAWTNAGGLPGVERTDPLPADETEVAERHATLKSVDLISTEASIRERHPEWSDEQVRDELAAIRADTAATLPQIGPPPPREDGNAEAAGEGPPEPPGQQD